MSIRVLEIVNGLSLEHGGPPRNAVELHAALDRRSDISSHLISARGDGANVEILLGNDFPRPRPARSAGPSNPAVRLLRLLLTCDVLIVHGYYIWWAPAVTATARLIGKTVLVIPHGSLTRHQRRYSRLRKALWELLPGLLTRRAAAAFVVGSEAERTELHEVFPNLVAPVSGIGTAIPPVPHAAPTAAGDGVSEPVRLLSMSRIAPKKRIDLMIDAVAELRNREVAARLVIAGDGDPNLVERLRVQAERLGIQDRVEFRGLVSGDAKEAVYADAQLLLAPSDDENFGISVAEALARGLPIVASSAVGAVAGLPASAGLVIDSPTGATVADGVQALLRQDPADLRAGARAFAEERFDWDAVADRWVRIIESASTR